MKLTGVVLLAALAITSSWANPKDTLNEILLPDLPQLQNVFSNDLLIVANRTVSDSDPYK